MSATRGNSNQATTPYLETKLSTRAQSQVPHREITKVIAGNGASRVELRQWHVRCWAVQTSDVEVSNTSGQHTGLDLFVNVISAEATLKELLFNLCQDCKERMSCIPPSAFSAKRIRESQREMKVATPNKQEPSSKYFNTMLMELSPLQYNSKMMNSVWGLYNRYSSHNVKTNNDVCGLQSQEVQPNAASSKNDSVINFSGKVKLDNFWTAFNFSQSH